MNKTPQLYKRKEDCYGCTACFAICPVDAIVMKYDEEGFEYPVIDADRCTNCSQCIVVCPMKSESRTGEQDRCQ